MLSVLDDLAMVSMAVWASRQPMISQVEGTEICLNDYTRL